MIPAARSRWFGWWFGGVAQRRIQARFDRVYAGGLPALAQAAREAPVLVVSNHTAWWDALVVVHLFWNVLPLEAFAMMDAKNLRALPFFRRVGAFGVDLDDPRDGARAIRYAARLLDRPGRLVWIFAQGREVPVTARPLGFRPGAVALARIARNAVVVPAALRYEMGSRPDPSLYLSFGAPMTASDARAAPAAAATALEDAVASQLDAIDARLVAGDTRGLELLHAKKEGHLFAVAQRMLAVLTR